MVYIRRPPPALSAVECRARAGTTVLVANEPGPNTSACPDLAACAVPLAAMLESLLGKAATEVARKRICASTEDEVPGTMGERLKSAPGNESVTSLVLPDDSTRQPAP